VRLKQLIILILFLFPPLLTCPAFPQAAGNFSVVIAENTLSVRAEKVALQTILLEFVAQGITVRIDPAINPLVSASFSKRPIEQALESLLKPASYSLLWESRKQNGDSPVMQLAEIQVFQTGSMDQMQTLKRKHEVNITKTSEGIFYVKDELLLYIPSEKILTELQQLIRTYDAVLVEHKGLPGPVRIILPPNSDVFAIAREIKNRLGLEISQPHYAYPIQSPVLHPVDSTVQNGIDPGYYSPTDNNTPIAILDSGLAADASLEKFVLSSLDVMAPTAPISDTLGHGTQMALIATGVVKPYGFADDNDSYIPIIPIRAFDDNGFTTDLMILDAINFALENNARILSLSWGSETKSDFMERTLSYANDMGLIIVASAGNEPTGRPVYPAAYPSVIGIGALEPHGKTWENSNFGNFVTLYAPGFALLPVGYKGDPGVYAGTSISAAFVANTLAGFLSKNPAATPQEIRNFLQTKFNGS
jgi:thermitase